MKKRIALVVLVALMAVFLSGPSAQAGGTYTCDILRIGMAGQYTFLLLSSNDFSGTKWCYLDPTSLDAQKQMLAVVLTSLAIGEQLWVQTSGDGVYECIDSVYINMD